MKKLIFLLLFICCGKLFAQDFDNDVYLDYFLRTFPYIENGMQYQRTTRGTVSVRDGSTGVSLINLNRPFETNATNPIGEFNEYDGLLSARTNATSVRFSGTFRVDTSPRSFTDSDNGEINTVNTSRSLRMSFAPPGPQYVFEPIVTLVEKMNISAPNSTECYDVPIRLTENSLRHPGEAIKWQFIGPLASDVWEYINPSSTFELANRNISLAQLYPDADELSQRIGRPIRFRIHNVLNDYFTDEVNYTWFDCPPEFDDVTTTNTTCALGSNDGSATVTFLEDINPGFQMRYFIYQGDPANFPIGAVDDDDPDAAARPDDVYDNITLDALVDEGNGVFSGSTNNDLEPGDYFIVYQEVFDDGLDVTVTSGAITTQFTVDPPSPVAIEGIRVTQPICSTTATGSATVDIVPLSGQDFETGTYEYSSDDGATWQDSPTFDNLVQGNSYIFRAKLVFPDGRECISTDSVTERIDIVTNILTINTGSGPANPPTNDASNDGELFIRVDGGAPEYTFELYNRLNPTVVLQTNTVDETIVPNNVYTFEDLDEGTYFAIVRDATCDVTSGDYLLEAAETPTLSALPVTQISCNNANDATITVNATYPEATTFTYELRTGQTLTDVVRDGEFASTTIAPFEADITISNLEAGNFTLFVRAAVGGFSSVAIPEITNPDPITVSITAVPFSCFDSTDGAITVVATGATNYDYQLSTDVFTWLPLTGTTIPVSDPNFYGVTLRDRDNPSCVSALSNDVEVTRPLAISITEITGSHLDVSANGLSDGALEILVANETPGYTYSWTRSDTPTGDKTGFTPPAGSTNTSLVNLPFGFYQVTLIDDANICPDVVGPEIEITQPVLLGITNFIGTDTCNGDPSGTLTATVQGTGDIFFEFLLNPGPGETVPYSETSTNRTVTVPNLGAGTYGLRITEVASNEVRTTDPTDPINPIDYVIITELAEITADVAKTDVSCDGFTRGTITISGVTGGSPFITGPNSLTGYEYRINDNFNTFQRDAVFNNVAVGNYTLTVRDALGCEFNTMVDIIQDGAPVLNTLTTIVTNASSDTSTDGSIVLDFEGDDTNYTYDWTGAGVTVNNVKDQIAVPAGAYQVTVSAPGNCTEVFQFNVGIADAFSVTNITATPTCFAPINGTLTATIEATGNVIHNWRDAADDSLVVSETTTVRTVTATGLPAGTYYLEIIDAVNTALTARSPNVEIIGQPEVDADIDLLPACSGADTGAITFSNPTGSLTGDYLFSIDGGANFVLDLVFNDLAAGTYQIVIRATDNTNCDRVVPDVVIPTAPPLLYDAANTAVTRASGPNATDGQIAVAFAQGTPPYQYSIDNGVTFQPSPIFTGLGEGTYVIIVTDAAGCSIPSENIAVTEIGPLSITNIIPEDARCRGEATGAIQTTVTGEGIITYEWTLADGSPVPVSNGIASEDISGILAGSYILRVTDINSTVISPPILIGEPTTALEIQNINSTPITCNGANDGTLQIVASGGTAPYEYSLNGIDFQTGDTFANLQPAQYAVTVRDANGCLFNSPTPELLTEPEELSFIINEQRALTAANAANGAILITPEGGSGTYTYSWTGPNFTSADEDIFNLVGGEYILTLTDANNLGCNIVSQPITIAEPGVLIATNTQTIFLECNGDNFAEIIATAQGGVGPYTYEWFQVVNGNNNQLAEDTEIIANLSAGSYFVRITDSNNVVAEANPVIINQPEALQITVDAITNVLCTGDATGTITISVSGGTFPYQYVWSNGLTIEDINGLEAGDYNIEVVDALGCIADETITIATPDDALQIVDATLINVSTYNAADGSITLDILGGLAPYTYLWSRASDNVNMGNQAGITDLTADSYTVTITDANGCNITETYEVNQPDIVAENITQPSCSGDSDGSISVLVNEGNGDFEYVWSTGATENTITGLTAGTYSVTITGFETGAITRTYILENPEPLIVNLGSDRVLCQDQTLALDATVSDATATYIWSSDNGFTSTAPNVILTESGNYTVTVQTPSGCTAQGNVSVAVNTDVIDAEFAVSSQVFAGESVIAVDISYPLPETIAWEIPLGAEIITQNSDEVELVFATPGEYEITIITTRGGCIAQKTKKVLVMAKDGLIEEENDVNGQKLVEDFMVYPNPTDGRFTVDVNLTERGAISIKIFSFANNALMASEKKRGEANYSIPFDISGIPSGVYAVLLETSYGTSLRKIVVR